MKKHFKIKTKRAACLSAMFLFLALCSEAQLFEKKQYPSQYFQWPVGATIGIVANFGELRNNHFHMGLDCRTDQVENKPVYAAAEGYVAKIKIEPSGFGRAIYINHPNGLTTLYAHLNDFNPELEAYVKQQQYDVEKWNIFIDIPPSLFPVNKGELIAYSGNTGGSQGPHLHFEIRDTKTDKVLNPLLFDMPITDHISPSIIRLAIYDRTKSTYEQTPRIMTLKKADGVYVPENGNLTVNTPKVSFAITAFDQYSGSTNQNGIYQAVMLDNYRPISGFQIDSISYAETRYMNANIDFRLKYTGGPYLQHLSRLPGNSSAIYKADQSDGVLDLTDEKEHYILISVSDPNGNTSHVRFRISMSGLSPKIQGIAANTENLFQPGFVNIFENDHLQFYLGEDAIYDSFHFKYNESRDNQGKTTYQVHNPSIPLQNYFTLRIKESFSPADTGKIVMQRFYGAKSDYAKANFEDGWYKASFREMGNFKLILDNTPPAVSPMGFSDNMNAAKLKRILFVVTDNTKEIKQFTALLDGEWLRFTNDKGRNFIYNFDEKCPVGNHELRIIAEDLVGNKTTKTYHFTR